MDISIIMMFILSFLMIVAFISEYVTYKSIQKNIKPKFKIRKRYKK